MSYENRIKCLYTLKEIGYQVGCGFMVGSPGQTIESLAKDMQFITELQPQMVGIGPFVPHHETPFADETKRTDTLHVRSAASVKTESITSGNYSTWHDRSKRTGKGHLSRSKCSDAESFPNKGTEKI